MIRLHGANLAECMRIRDKFHCHATPPGSVTTTNTRGIAIVATDAQPRRASKATRRRSCLRGSAFTLNRDSDSPKRHIGTVYTRVRYFTICGFVSTQLMTYQQKPHATFMKKLTAI